MAMAILPACSVPEEFPQTATHSACAVECDPDDIDCVEKSMRECVL